MSDLKLIALDADDLHVLSAHLQDAVLRVGDMAFLPREKRFVALANRFDWSNKLSRDAAGRRPVSAVRKRTAVRCERVLSARVTGMDLADKRAALALLAMTFDRASADAPDGNVTLTFSGGAAIRLAVECLEVQMQDLGAAWKAKSSPEHPDDPT